MHGYHQAMPGIESEYAFWYPAQSGVFSWRAQLPHGILARSRVGVLDRYEYKTYGLWDVYVARSTGRIHPFVQLTNLTNTSYQEVQMVVDAGPGCGGRSGGRRAFRKEVNAGIVTKIRKMIHPQSRLLA